MYKLLYFQITSGRIQQKNQVLDLFRWLIWFGNYHYLFIWHGGESKKSQQASAIGPASFRDFVRFCSNIGEPQTRKKCLQKMKWNELRERKHELNWWCDYLHTSKFFWTILGLFLGLLGGLVPRKAQKSCSTCSFESETENLALSSIFFWSWLVWCGCGALVLKVQGLRSIMVESLTHLRNLWLPHLRQGMEKLWRGFDLSLSATIAVAIAMLLLRKLQPSLSL